MSRRGLVVLLVVCALAPLMWRGSAAAHPSGTYTINRYARIELYHGVVRLYYIADYSELPSLQWSILADADGDGAISEPELTAYVDQAKVDLLDQLSLTFGGASLSLVPTSDSATFKVTDLGVETLRFEIVYEAATAEGMGTGELEFRDENFSGIQGWRTVTVKPSSGTISTVSAGFLADISNGLTVVPEEWKSFPPKVRVVSFDWDPRTGESLVVVPDQPVVVQTDQPSQLGRLLRSDISVSMIVLAMLLAFVIGFADSLGPGHGKTVVGTYMVGREGSASEAIKIGVLAAVTHAATTITFGLLTLGASALFLPRAFAAVGLVAGVSTIAFGVALIYLRVTGWHAGHVLCSCGSAPRRERSTLLVGIASGLVPCPTAIILLLSAVSLGRFSFGALLVVAFSLGTASALFCVAVGSLLIQRTAHQAGRLSAHATRAANALPVVSSLIMILAGILITRQAISGHML